MTKIVTLLSGGLDSTTALALAITKVEHHSGNEILALSFDYGQRHRTRELLAARQIALHYGVKHEIIDLYSVGRLLEGSSLTDYSVPVPDGHYAEPSMAATIVPNRNAIMLSIAYGVARSARALEVWAGMHAGDHFVYPDCRSGFVNALERALHVGNDDVALVDLVTPFITVTKTDIVRLGTKLEVPYHLTYSCYKGKEAHCGTCGTCNERKEAFNDAGVTDPTQYADPNLQGATAQA